MATSCKSTWTAITAPVAATNQSGGSVMSMKPDAPGHGGRWSRPSR